MNTLKTEDIIKYIEVCVCGIGVMALYIHLEFKDILDDEERTSMLRGFLECLI